MIEDALRIVRVIIRSGIGETVPEERIDTIMRNLTDPSVRWAIVEIANAKED